MAKTFTVERSAVIPAPIARVYGLVSDFHEWTRWSPWEDKDPDMQRTYDGAESGTGATYAWQGNRDVGSGTMEITDATENERIVIALSFLKPFKAENQTVFAFAEEGDGTRVTWTMTGTRNLMMAFMGLFMNFDKMIGGDFEKGLARMSTAAGAA